MPNVDYRPRYPLMAMGMIALLTAMWAGLLRMGWALPTPQPGLALNHGPLMISGFLGTVIGMERAVALYTLFPNYRWIFIGPLLTGAGAVLLIIGIPGPVGPILMTLGSVNLVIVFALILRMQTALYTGTMAVGALLWLVGNGLWLLGWPVYTVVYWWGAFLILTIAGERIELNRVLRLSRPVLWLFTIAVGLLLAGLVVSLLYFDSGVKLVGVGMLALALWLLRFDIVRYTIKKAGLTRFMAACLVIGYIWLALGGLLGPSFGGVTAGFQYDAILHAMYVGFVMSMIFAHAPIIFPAVLGKAVPYHPIFYSHLIVLHLSLILRVVGDLTLWLPGRQWGGLLNAVAILLFVFNTMLAIRRGMAASPTSSATLQEAT